jgi:2-methylaconitate cis-trans-isomerase PrpF
MKSASISKSILAVTILLAGTAFAGDSFKGNFQLSSPTQVSGKQLPAGDYVAKWDGSGPDVQVNIVKNGKTVATVPAKLVQLNAKASEDAAELKSGSNGNRELTSLRFSGKKYSLEITPGAEAKTQSGEGMK